VVLGTIDDGRVQFVAGVTRDLTARLKAGDIVKQVAAEAGGKGGGRDEFASGSGTEPAKLGVALQRAFTVVENALQKN
jgi:alanyl-tRNA synthetase